jgi:HAD superfamily hydrolase (TIGR01509 family)
VNLCLELAVTNALRARVYTRAGQKQGKPAPDLLTLLRKMDVGSADYMVVEDSAAGIEAAQRAGDESE